MSGASDQLCFGSRNSIVQQITVGQPLLALKTPSGCGMSPCTAHDCGLTNPANGVVLCHLNNREHLWMCAQDTAS
jgi:hypothetical protein